MCFRMESPEKCDAVISHFNGKFIKTAPGVPGKRETRRLLSLFEIKHKLSCMSSGNRPMERERYKSKMVLGRKERMYILVLRKA